MRTIKFRAWDKEEKKFVSDVFNILLRIGEPLSNEKFEFMQYTGLLDKDGKEIYEGDIVKGRFMNYNPMADEYEKCEKMGGSIFWSYSGWQFKVIESLCDKERYGMVNYFDFTDHNRFSSNFGDMKVIGNIYQNPELLK